MGGFGSGRPAKTIHAAQELQALLLDRFKPGHKWKRQDWNAIVVRSLGVGINQADNLTRTGEAAGLWLRHHKPWQPGTVELLATGLLPPMPTASPQPSAPPPLLGLPTVATASA